jgi:hypothetical protein
VTRGQRDLAQLRAAVVRVDVARRGPDLRSGACSPALGRLDVFAHGEDNAIWHTWSAGDEAATDH